MDGDGMVSLSGAAILAVGGLLSAMSLAVVGLFRHLLSAQAQTIAMQALTIAAKDETIGELRNDKDVCRQERDAWREAAFGTLPILQKQSEVAADAFTLARKRGAA